MTNGTSYDGPYRAVIADVIDPLAAGRVRVRIPFVQAEDDEPVWAIPCVPYAGTDRGLFLSPEVGDAAWVVFESGNPEYPVWIGCYWENGDMPSGEDDRKIRFLRTTTGEVALDDAKGMVRIEKHTDGPEAAVGDVDLALQAADGAGITMEGEDITFQGWPMRFKPVPPSDDTLEARVVALEQAIASITGQPFPP